METMKGKHMIDINRRVYVYFNLHKKVWSVRQDGKIVEHTKHIMLKDARFLVGQAGRKKVLREKRKNVHAGVSGYVVGRVPNVPDICFNVTYNPYKYETFVDCMYQKPIGWSEYAVLECGDGWRNVEAVFNHIKDVKKRREFLSKC
jgi:hypothetical protein